MAFATTNVQTIPTGNSWRTVGSWTGNIGDAAGSIKVPGARLISANFFTGLASGGPASPVQGTGSGTLPITVTVGPYNANVTAGSFEIVSM